VQAGEADLPVHLDLREKVRSIEKQEASRRTADFQQKVGMDVPAHIAIRSVKEALLEAARESDDADVLMIGRSHLGGSHGRMRDLTYAIVRDSPFPMLSV
jgi:nucleotide-binding universal stress UspA family protein